MWGCVVYRLNYNFSKMGKCNDLHRLECPGEGRFPDLNACGQFYDCTSDSNGSYVMTRDYCRGFVYNATARTCSGDVRVSFVKLLCNIRVGMCCMFSSVSEFCSRDVPFLNSVPFQIIYVELTLISPQQIPLDLASANRAEAGARLLQATNTLICASSNPTVSSAPIARTWSCASKGRLSSAGALAERSVTRESGSEAPCATQGGLKSAPARSHTPCDKTCTTPRGSSPARVLGRSPRVTGARIT